MGSRLTTIGTNTGLGLMEYLAFEGRLFIASDADENDRVTGQTSFAATTPTFLLHVPDGTTAIPLFVNLTQAGTVAGGDIGIAISIDNAGRYSAGGTAELAYNPRTSSGRVAASTLYSGPTATAGYGIRVFSAVTAADVSPAEGAVQGPYWSAEIPYLIEGRADDCECCVGLFDHMDSRRGVHDSWHRLSHSRDCQSRWVGIWQRTNAVCPKRPRLGHGQPQTSSRIWWRSCQGSEAQHYLYVGRQSRWWQGQRREHAWPRRRPKESSPQHAFEKLEMG